MGDQGCENWALAHAAASDAEEVQYRRLTEVWLWGYLRGMADQWSFATKKPNPLVKLDAGEEVTWLGRYCQLFPRAQLSAGAVALLVELMARK